jgi:hypothetical protein
MAQNGWLILLVRISGYRSLIQTPPGHPAGWFARSRIAFWAGQLSFQVGEGLDDFRCLEGAVALAYVDLLEYAGVHEAGDGVVDSVE